MAPTARAPYAFPPSFIARCVLNAAVGRTRDAGLDGASLLATRADALVASHLERMPATGPFIAVMNHYEATGIRVWWPALFVSNLARRRRGEAPQLRWLIADRFFRTRWRGIRIPDALVALAFWLIARLYGAIIVSRVDVYRRASALRQARRTLRGPTALPVALTPEGALGHGPVLVEPLANSSLAVAWLSRGEIPVLPVGVFESHDGRLTARFGEPFVIEWPGLREARRRRETLTRTLMGAVAELLPPELRGPFGGPGAITAARDA